MGNIHEPAGKAKGKQQGQGGHMPSIRSTTGSEHPPLSATADDGVGQGPASTRSSRASNPALAIQPRTVPTATGTSAGTVPRPLAPRGGAPEKRRQEDVDAPRPAPMFRSPFVVRPSGPVQHEYLLQSPETLAHRALSADRRFADWLQYNDHNLDDVLQHRGDLAQQPLVVAFLESAADSAGITSGGLCGLLDRRRPAAQASSALQWLAREHPEEAHAIEACRKEIRRVYSRIPDADGPLSVHWEKCLLALTELALRLQEEAPPRSLAAWRDLPVELLESERDAFIHALPTGGIVDTRDLRRALNVFRGRDPDDPGDRECRAEDLQSIAKYEQDAHVGTLVRRRHLLVLRTLASNAAAANGPLLEQVLVGQGRGEFLARFCLDVASADAALKSLRSVLMDKGGVQLQQPAAQTPFLSPFNAWQFMDADLEGLDLWSPLASPPLQEPEDVPNSPGDRLQPSSSGGGESASAQAWRLDTRPAGQPSQHGAFHVFQSVERMPELVPAPRAVEAVAAVVEFEQRCREGGAARDSAQRDARSVLAFARWLESEHDAPLSDVLHPAFPADRLSAFAASTSGSASDRSRISSALNNFRLRMATNQQLPLPRFPPLHTQPLAPRAGELGEFQSRCTRAGTLSTSTINVYTTTLEHFEAWQQRTHGQGLRAVASPAFPLDERTAEFIADPHTPIDGTSNLRAALMAFQSQMSEQATGSHPRYAQPRRREAAGLVGEFQRRSDRAGNVHRDTLRKHVVVLLDFESWLQTNHGQDLRDVQADDFDLAARIGQYRQREDLRANYKKDVNVALNTFRSRMSEVRLDSPPPGD